MCAAMLVTRRQRGETVVELSAYVFCAGSLVEVKKRIWD